MQSKQNVGIYQANELIRDSLGSTRLQSCRLAPPLWTEPSLKSWEWDEPISVTPPCYRAEWHVKDPAHSARSACRRLQLNTHAPLTQRSRSGLTMLSKHIVGTYQGNEITRNSPGNILPL